MRSGNLALFSAVCREYRLLCHPHSKDSCSTVIGDCLKLSEQLGSRGLVALLNVLVEDLDFTERRTSDIPFRARKLELFKNLVQHKLDNFPSAFCQALLSSGLYSENYLNNFVDAVPIHFELKVEIALSVSQAPDENWSQEGLSFLKEKLLEFDDTSVQVSSRVLHELLTFIDSQPELFTDYFSFVERVRERTQFFTSELCFLPFFKPCSEIEMSSSSIEDTYTLPGLLEDFGYVATSNAAVFRGILEKFRINESVLAEMLGKMVRTHTGLEGHPQEVTSKGFLEALFSGTSNALPKTPPTGWNFDLVVDTIKSMFPDLSWFGVVLALDYDEFYVPEFQAFELLMGCFKRGIPGPFPLETVIGRPWRNTEGQLSFLRYAIQSPPEIFTFEHSRKKMTRLDGIQNGKTPFGTPNHAWLCLDLVKTLCALGEMSQLTETVMEILESPMKHCQEVLMVVMATVSTDWGKVQRQVGERLLPNFISTNPNSSIVLHRIWPTCKDRIIEVMGRMYETDNSIISRVLDICQELKVLTQVLNALPYVMAADTAALAARREYLNLDKWLKDKFSSDGAPFVEAVLQYLDGKLHTIATEGSTGLTALTIEILDVYLRMLQSHRDAFPAELANNFEQVQIRAQELFPQLRSLAAQAEQSELFAKDIEEEANLYFKRIYSEQTRLEDAIAMLKRYKTSGNRKEQEVFACMVHNLFDEYRFFPNYPDHPLHITAVLFGQLIHHQLVSSITLGIALRYVLDALKKTGDHRMFSFGLTALHQFKEELAGWPQYCTHVLHIPMVREADPELVLYIKEALKNSSNKTPVNEPPGLDSIPSMPTLPPISGPLDAQTSGTEVPVNPNEGPQNSESAGNSSTGGGPSAQPSSSVFAANNSSVLESAMELLSDFPEPPEATKDKVAFIFNNLSAMNLESKVVQLEESISDEFDQWLASYIVIKRAAQESNFQNLYMSLLDHFPHKRLMEFIVQFTYHCIKCLLDTDRIKTEMSDRSLLKNLGSWLGQLTLAKNKPVRQKDLDLKAIIYDAYEKGRMVYGPDNPWIKGILTLLAEIYQLEGLKINISFEIEMIFKDFEVSMKDVEPLKSLDQMERELEGNPDFYDQVRPMQQAPGPPPQIGVQFDPAAFRKGTHQLPLETPEAHPSSQLLGLRPPPGMEQSSLEATQQTNLPRPNFPTPNFPSMPTPGVSTGGMPPMDASGILGQVTATLHQLVNINPSLASVAERVPLKRLVSAGIDRAIYEIITPVVERSVMIACTTTKDLVTKDFAMEPDEKKLRQAAHLMVSSLAGSLALVTCKEPLRMSLFSQLKSLLTGHLDPGVLEPAVNMVIADNLDLGCTIIEKASTDKAVKEVDERLLPYYQSRQKARAANTPFYDMSIFSKNNGRFPAALPESLRPRPGHLTPQMTRVYDDFARIPRSSQQLLVGDQPQSPQMDPQQPPMQQQEPILGPYKPTTLAERLAMWQARLDAALSKENQGLDLNDLPETSEVHSLVSELGEIVNMSQKREDVAIGLAEKLFIRMFDRTTTLSCSVSCAGLNALKLAGFARLPCQLTSWYCQVCQNESRRFNRVVIDCLAKANLIHYPELDLFLTGCLSSRTGPFMGSVDFIVGLISQNMIAHRIMKASDLNNTLEVLRRLAAVAPDGEGLLLLIEEARKVPRDHDPDGLREQVTPMFDNWARTVHEDGASEKSIAACVDQFIKKGFLKGDDVTNRFFRICIELSVLHCVNTEVTTAQGTKTGDGRVSFVMIDAFVKLVVTLKDHIEELDSIAGLKRIMEIIVLVLYRDHDDRASEFNSRPHYRLFIGLYNELLPEDLDELGSFEIVTTLASALISCRPQRVAGFTFAWMELFSHRMMMSRLLRFPDKKGWPYFRALFMGILYFMQPYLRHGELDETLRILYKGLLRIMLVLLHDFPEFYCEFHIELCNIIPPSCVQMRNLILSASPRHILIPDPFAPNMNIENLPDIKVDPVIVTDVGAQLPEELRLKTEEYIRTGSPSTFLDTFIKCLFLPSESRKTEGTSYNVTYMNCLVLYCGMVSLSCEDGQTIGGEQGTTSHAMEIFNKLASDLDTEGRYLFLNAIANQLRYPNTHTRYFSNLLLTLFAEAEAPIMHDQIARVVLERLIAHRPHPWGLFITFIELIKNPKYRFWELGVTKSAPEIEPFFENVARSVLQALPEGTTSTTTTNAQENTNKTTN
eukprot:g3440.t1